MNTPATCYEGYNLKITRLQYYLNNFIITHDGGQMTETTQHFLVHTNQSTELDLGSLDITQVEKITFSIGVNPSRNHSDPSVYPAGSALAPQNPSMHWGWSAGYRFVAVEGKAGENVNFLYEIHAVGDSNYKTVSIDTEGALDGNALTITLDADYLGLFKNIDVSAGLIEHSETGSAITLMNNFENNVFFAEGQIETATINPSFEGKFQIQPNPSFEKNTTVTLDLPNAAEYKLTLTDLAGRIIHTQNINAGFQNIKMETAHAGIYFIHLWKNGTPVAFEKWITY